MADNKQLPDELLDMVSGGTLPAGWEKLADLLLPKYRAMYPNVTFDEAMDLVRQNFTDENDIKAIEGYLSKLFDPVTGKQL